MTPPNRDPDRRLRAFPTMDSPRFVGVVFVASFIAALAVVMLVAGPIVVKAVGALLLAGCAVELWKLRAKRRYEAIVVDGSWVGYRSGTKGVVTDWTDLNAVTYVYVERLHPKVRKQYVNVAIWNLRSGPYRRDPSWGVASLGLRGARAQRRKLGEMAICIPLGSMTRDDQQMVRAHLAEHGIDVADPTDDARWPT